MKTIKKYISKNPCYKQNKSLTPKGLMLHSIGVPQPKATVLINQMNVADAEKAVHGIIDAETGNYYHMMPYTRRAWHCGSGSKGSGNDSYIGIEMCEPSTIKYTSGAQFKDNNPEKTKATVKLVYNSAVEVFADLCIKYNLDPEKNIISHAEGHKQGIASNHGDPDHILKVAGLSMDSFRKDVKAKVKKLKSADTTTAKTESTTPKKETTTSSTTTVNYTVKIDTDSLNVRKGPSVNYDIVTEVKSGEVYTIVAEQNGWGQLKSGAGWINLSYTKKTTTTASSSTTSATKKETTTNKVVTVNVNNLNVRKGPGVSYDIATVIHKGEAYTIVEEKNGWGKLKSGAGWINLSYVKNK